MDGDDGFGISAVFLIVTWTCARAEWSLKIPAVGVKLRNFGMSTNFLVTFLVKIAARKVSHFSSHTSLQTSVMLNQLRIKHYSHEVELTLFLPDDTTKGVAKHSFRLQPSINLHVPVTGVAEYSFRLQPSINLHVPVTGSAVLVPIVLPRKDEDSGIGPVQWSKLHIILAPTQNSNSGGLIQNHKRWSTTYTTTAHKNLLAAHSLTGCDPVSVFACIRNATGSQETRNCFQMCWILGILQYK